MDEFTWKPFNVTELMEKIDSIMGGKPRVDEEGEEPAESETTGVEP